MATPNRQQIYKKTAINLVSESNAQPRESGSHISNNIVKKSNFWAIMGAVNVARYISTVFSHIIPVAAGIIFFQGLQFAVVFEMRVSFKGGSYMYDEIRYALLHTYVHTLFSYIYVLYYYKMNLIV